jgi:flagellar hook-associated protein 1 FlgK
MSLDLALSIARNGLAHVNRQLAQAAGNVANAATPGYTRKEVQGSAVAPGGLAAGVRSLEAWRDVDMALVAQMNAARAAGAEASARVRILERVELAHGGPGESIGDLTAALGDAFVSLREDPSEPLLQAGVINAANALAERYNTVSLALGEARQAAHDSMIEGVATLNDALRQVARLTDQIRPVRAQGLSTATLEDQRDAAIARLSEVLEVRVVRQDDGGVMLLGEGGLSLPLYQDRDVFSMNGTTVGATSFHGPAGTLPGVMMNGVDVTNRLGGGSLAAYAALRDEALPRQQAELDVAAANLAARFEAQGLRLFTGDAGTVPDPSTAYATGGWIGFAGALRTNPVVEANTALIRDGTHAVAATPGGPTAFTPNGAGGPAGFTTMVDRVLDYAFGAEDAPGSSHPAFATTGLGPDGGLSSSLVSPRTLAEFATQLVAAQTSERARATAAGQAANDLLGTLEGRFAERSGVDMDKELASMIVLQNAYAANARLISAVQTMYDTLFSAIR